MAEKNARIQDITSKLQKIEKENKQVEKKAKTAKSTTKKTTKSSTSKTSKNKATTTNKNTKKEKTSSIQKKSQKDDQKVKKLIAEQMASMQEIQKKSDRIKNIEKQKGVKEKKEPKEEKKPFNSLEMERKLESKKKLPLEEKNRLYKDMILNVVIAIGITIYIIFLQLGCLNIDEVPFQIDLKAFSVTLIVVTIITFEKAYKEDSGKLTMWGIEIFVLSIVTLVSLYMHKIYFDYYVKVMGVLAILVSIYYIIKIIYIYIKGKKDYKNSISDVKQILKN